ncbi:hypothetical protein FZZ93_02355 [Halomonas eurihalina]|uniref:Uncharacterized protein n=1 Tax=Halomonas eurihalina TaxID=42566 RepID=A0A5D9DFT2_HALER|nr:hypothetical protein [Halomonas eurihalina]MDR5857963.1 hypothetical protein [Halomonas eurihalina]TZG41525.1 hypothetical protein FZZ93_02355 [Halomonas eurihalina]
MVDFASLGTGLRTAYEIARSAKDVNDQARLNSAVADIMEQLTTAQFSLFELQQQHQQLLDENKALRDQIESDRRFSQYRLEQTPAGSYIMPLRDEYVSEEFPQHSICHVCREKGTLSILSEYPNLYICPSCEYKAWKARPQKRSSRVIGP